MMNANAWQKWIFRLLRSVGTRRILYLVSRLYGDSTPAGVPSDVSTGTVTVHV